MRIGHMLPDADDSLCSRSVDNQQFGNELLTARWRAALRTRLFFGAINILSFLTLIGCNPYYYQSYYPYDPYGPPPVYAAVYGAYPQAARYSVPPSLSQTSYNFAVNLALSDSYDIKAGQLARLRSRSPEIRRFAGRAVAGNTTITRNLTTTMQRSGTPLAMPSALDPHHQSMIDDLS